MIAALLKAQWRSIRNLRPGGGRWGGVLLFAAGAVWYGLWIVCAGAAFGFASNPESVATLRLALPRGLMFVFLYWQLAPVLAASMGASLDLRKIRLYPVPEGTLFFIEVLLRLTTSIEMLLVTAGLLLGLSRNPVFAGPAASLNRLGLFFLFAAFNLLLAAGVRSLLERLLMRKHLREVLALAVVFVAVLPQLAVATGARLEALRGVLFTAPYRFWPWSAAGRLALSPAGWTDWATLAAWTALAWAFGRWQFARNLRFDFEQASGSQVTASPVAARWSDRLYGIPATLLPQPLGAVVGKELRTLSRTPRFRTVFIMGFSFGLIVWLPLALRRPGDSALAADFLTLVCVYALALLGQVSYFNAFGFDRSAAKAYFLWPTGLRVILAGKNLAAAVFILLEMLAVTAASMIFRIPIAPAKVGEAFLVTPVVALYLLAAGNLSSVHMPRALAPERVTQGGVPGRFQALMLVVYPIALIPAGLAYLARYAFSSQTAFYLVLASAAALGAAVYRVAMDSAVEAASRKRELFLAELSRGESPVTLN